MTFRHSGACRQSKKHSYSTTPIDSPVSLGQKVSTAFIAIVRKGSRGPAGSHLKKVNISQVLAGQTLGLKEVEENTWLMSFMDHDLSYIDLDEKGPQPP